MYFCICKSLVNSSPKASGQLRSNPIQSDVFARGGIWSTGLHPAVPVHMTSGRATLLDNQYRVCTEVFGGLFRKLSIYLNATNYAE